MSPGRVPFHRDRLVHLTPAANHRDAWRAMLLGTVAAGALLLGYGRRAYADCVASGTTLTCTGDIAGTGVVNGGIALTAPYDTLNVNNLTSNISPTAGVEGIYFYTTASDININSHTGPFAITVTGITSGIYALAAGGDNITIVSTGDISSAGGNGIEAVSVGGAGSVMVAHAGNISAATEGISAIADVGNVTIASTGDITSATAEGIFAYASNVGNTYVASSGTVKSATYGIVAMAASGSVSVAASGTIVATANDAIRATASDDITVANSARLQATNGQGIYADSDTNAAIANSGDVTADIGLWARGIDSVMIANSGRITGTSYGIYGLADEVTIVSTGNVSGDTAIQALAGTTATVILSNSTVAATTTGVQFANGTNTLITNNTVSITGSTAVAGGSGNDTIKNYGTLTAPGIIDLGAGTNAFNNYAGAVFNAGTLVEVGVLTNAGTLAPGGIGNVEVTAVGDDMVQTPTGILAIDLDGAAGTTDQVAVSNTAALAGHVAVNVTSLPTPGPHEFLILEALSGVTNNGLGLTASPALHTALLFTATEVWLATSVDFDVSGLNRNETDIAGNLNTVFLAGGGGLTPVLLGLLNTPGFDAYKDALDQLSPEIMSDAQIGALYASLGFANSLLSCKVNGSGTAAIIREGQCLWAGASAVFLDAGTTSQQIGFNQTSGLFAAGAQVALDNVWRLGFGAGYQQSALEAATGASTDGEQAQGGVALKYNPGAFLLAGVVNGGRAWTDTIRPMSFGGFTGIARSDTEIDILSGGVRLAYVFGAPQLYFKPVIDAAATRLDLGGFTESGGGAANLTVAGSKQTVYTIAPHLEIGTEWWMGNGTLVRPFLRGGATWYEGGNLTLTAAFVGAPAGVAPFAIFTDMDDVMGTVGTGIEMITAEDAVLRLSYDGQLGETTQIHSVGLKGSARF